MQEKAVNIFPNAYAIQNACVVLREQSDRRTQLSLRGAERRSNIRWFVCHDTRRLPSPRPTGRPTLRPLSGLGNDDGIHLDSTKTSILLLQFHQVKVIKGSHPTQIDRGTLRPISGAGVYPTCRGMNKSQGRWENIVLLPRRARLIPWPKSWSE